MLTETEYLKLIDNKIQLTKEQISELTDFEIESKMVSHSRWSIEMETIVQIQNRFFLISWSKAATEYQENYFDDQPVEVKPVKKMVEVTEWVSI